MVNIVKDSTASGVKWMVRWRAPDGTQRKKRGFAKKIDAENWAADNVTSAKAAGDYVDPRAGRTKCGDIYERWFESHRPIWKPSYTVDVDAAWRNHLSGKLADRAISGVRHSEIQAIVSDIASRRSASVTLRCFTIVKGIWQTAGSDGIIRSMRAVENISLPRKPSRKENRHYLTVPQLVRLADQCGRYRTLVLTLGLCGLRWGEAAALRPDDIDVNAGRIHVRRNVTKAGTQWVEGSPKSWEMRDVPIPAKLSPLLAAAKFGVRRDDRVFTDPDGHVLRNQTVGRGGGGGLVDQGSQRGWARTDASARPAAHGREHSHIQWREREGGAEDARPQERRDDPGHVRRPVRRGLGDGGREGQREAPGSGRLKKCAQNVPKRLFRALKNPGIRWNSGVSVCARDGT